MEEIPKEIKKFEVNISDFQTIMITLSSNEINDEIQNKETVLVIQIRIENGFDAFDALDGDSIEKLSNRFADKSAVIFLASKTSNNFLIYWKSKDIKNFLFLDFYFYEVSNDKNEQIFNFLADFLAKSLSKGKLG